MKNSIFFRGLLLALLLSITTAGAANLTGKWSGTMQLGGQTRSEPVYMVLRQEGNKLAGSGGPNESEQNPFEGGKVEGNKLTFDIPLGENSMHFEMEAQGDQITGEMKREREGKVENARVSLKRVAEK
jgi:hypothetical protein